MSDDKTSHTQQNPFFPFAMPAMPAMPMFGAEAWKQAADQWVARMTAMADEATKAEALGAERTRGAIEESARLMRETVTYSLQLSAEWRKLALESTRQMMATVLPGSTPKAG